jgi:hypothetical protein
MDATFRLPRWYRYAGLAGVLFCVVGGALCAYEALTEPRVGAPPLVAAAVLGGIPLALAGFPIWVLLACWREALTIRGERVIFRGIVGCREIGLPEVTEARWRAHPPAGSLVLRTESARLPIHFDNYKAEERERIVRYLRSVLRPEVQTGWNLFAYMVKFGEPPRTKPGPDEVLIRRERWDRYFAPSLVVTSLVGVVAWRSTGEWWRFLASPLLVLLAEWAWLRAGTPAEGMVQPKLSAPVTADLVRFLLFTLLWVIVGIAGLMANLVFQRLLRHPVAVWTVTMVVWFGVFLYECHLQDRRQSQRNREAADLAATRRGEAGADPWLTE